MLFIIKILLNTEGGIFKELFWKPTYEIQYVCVI